MEQSYEVERVDLIRREGRGGLDGRAGHGREGRDGREERKGRGSRKGTQIKGILNPNKDRNRPAKPLKNPTGVVKVKQLLGCYSDLNPV